MRCPSRPWRRGAVATAADIGARIEALWGRPLAELRAQAEASPGASMLAALLKLRDDTDTTERHLAYLRDRLHRLTLPDRPVDELADSARHLLDAAQRLSAAATARDAHRAAASAVLDGLRRRDTPTAPTAPALAVTASAPAADATRSR